MDIRGLLSDPLISFGAAMLDPTGTHGSFGASLSRGLLAQQAMKGSNLNQKAKEQLNKLREQQMAELAKQQQYREQMQQQMSQAAQPQPFKQDLFPGEQPTPGLLSNPNPQEVAQNRMGILGDYVMKTDPVGYYNKMIQQMQPQKPTNAMQRYQEQIALGVDPKIAMGNAFGHPPATSIVNKVGGPAQPATPMTDEQLAAYGFPPGSSGVIDDKGMPKLTSVGDAEKRKEWIKLSSAGNAVSNYKDLLEKYGTEQWPGPAKLALGSAYAEVLFQAKELANLGALQGPDLALMERVLIDPTSIMKSAYSGKDALAQLEQFEKKIDKAWETAIQMYGLPPGSTEVK